MPVAREGYDLFNRYQRPHVWRAIYYRIKYGKRYHVPWRLIWEDSFGRIFCWLFGHKPELASCPGEPERFACRRCHSWLCRDKYGRWRKKRFQKRG